MSVTRRRFLEGVAQGVAAGLAAGVTLAGARRARAIGQGSKFRIGVLDDGNHPRASGPGKLMQEIDKRTSIDCDFKTRTVSLDDDDLYQTPFLLLAGDRAFALPSVARIERLRKFLGAGGFLLCDSAEGAAGGAFDKAVRQLVTEVFPAPSAGLEAVPAEHVLYKSFYLLNEATGRVAVQKQLEAVFHDGRAVVVYSQNDLCGAWARDNFGNWEHECVPGGETQRELAFRLGVNVAMYALCLDYKTDQVHVPFILRRRKWKASE